MKNKSAIFVAAIILIFGVAYIANSAIKLSDYQPSAEEAVQAERAQKSKALYFANDMVKEQLAYPKTAKFDDPNAEYGEDNDYKYINGTVTSKNAFGVEIENPYSAILTLTESAYVPVALSIGEEVYYDYREEESQENPDAIAAARAMVKSAAAFPESVSFYPGSTEEQGEYTIVSERFDRTNSSGSQVTDKYKATIRYNADKSSYDPIALAIGDNVLYDYRLVSAPKASSQSPSSSLTQEERELYDIPENAQDVEIKDGIISYHYSEPLYENQDQSYDDLDRALAEQDWLSKYSNAK